MKLRLFKRKRESITALSFSLLFLFLNIVTFMMQKKLHLSMKEVLLAVLISILACPLLAELTIRLKSLMERGGSGSEKTTFVWQKSDAGYFFATALISLLCWFVVWLAFYPGLFAYDVIAQIQQVKLSEYTTHHPLVHTLVLGFCYEIMGGRVFKDYTLGIAFAALLQMVVFSLQLSFVHLFLRRLQAGRILRYILVAFGGLCPFFSVLSISMTKDVVFAGFLGMLAVAVAYFEIDYDTAIEKKSLKALLVAAVVGTSLMRSNGRYAVWFMAIVIVVKYFVQKKRKMLIYIAIALVISEGILMGLRLGLRATAPDKNEMLSIPFQQMAFVYEANYDTLSVEDKQIIETLIPDVINYNRIISDPIKFTGQYVDNKDLFWKTYLRLFKEHPRQYFEAFLQTNLGFLCIADKTNATVYGSGYERRRGFLMTYTRDGYGIEPASKLPRLEDLYLKLYCQNDYQKNIFTFLPCSMGLYFWLIVLSIFWMIDKKVRCFAVAGLVLSLGATTLLGPCAIIRYMLPYVVVLPVLWSSVFYAPPKR